MRALKFIIPALLLFVSCRTEPSRPDIYAVESLDGLSGFKVATGAGGSYDLMLSEIPGVEVVRIGVGELLLSVEKGMSDFCLMDATQAQMAHLEDRGLEVRMSGIMKSTASAGFRLDDQDLCNEFNAFLTGFKESGEYDRWNSQWRSDCDAMADALINRPRPQGGRTIRVGVTNDIFPYIYVKDGNLTGMEVDIMEHFCNSAGIVPEYIAQEFTTLIPALNSGKIDVILSHMRVTEERAKQVLFSEPYIDGGGALICKSPTPAKAEKPGIWQRMKISIERNLIRENRWQMLVEGLYQTILISLLSILAGTLIGILLCVVRMSRRKWVVDTSKVVIDLIRGIPILVLLMIMCYVIFASSRIPSLWLAVFSFGLYYGAYFCEIFRTGMMSVSPGQWEAGAALGLKKIQTLRLVVLPQALISIIPVFKGDVIALIKGTSIVGYVAVMDLTRAGDLIRSRTLDAFFPLIIVTIVYFFLSRIAGRGLDALNRKITPKSKAV